MKAYGVKKAIHPDVADIHAAGSKSCVGTICGKGGDNRGYFKNKGFKNRIRRHWKRKARRAGKAEIKSQLP